MENKRQARIHATYKLILERYEKEKHMVGICSVLAGLFRCNEITELESMETLEHLHQNRPSEIIHQEFFNSPDYHKGEMFWWKIVSYHGDVTVKLAKELKAKERQYRIDFLRKMIEITKPENI